jgi:cell fate regulator YaaT (PSP1 superfamily)
MTNVKINSTGQIWEVENSITLNPGQEILVEVEKLIEPAIVLCGKNCPKSNAAESEEKNAIFLRVLSDEDRHTKKELKKNAEGFIDEAKNKVFRHGLKMKILDADLSFDQKKLTFYFSADGRIDFRGLVADMAGDFRKIIRLQQISARGETKLFGGFGKCGRQLCCERFLNNLENVNSEMLEMQEGQNSKAAMYTGCCGKLMCCLSFENNNPKSLK